MAQPPPPGFANRAMTPVRNPVYAYNMDASFKQATPFPHNVLEAPPVPKGGDARRTSHGDVPHVAELPQYVPAAYQTPYNVWGLPA
jgi:hypothetical protein